MEASKKQHITNQRKFTVQLEHGIAVRDFLDEFPETRPFVITVVRDPLAQFISSFFQNLSHNYPGLTNSDGSWNELEIKITLEGIIESYDPSTAWVSNWYEAEFKNALNVDIYQTPFDHDAGYTLIEENNTRVLCLCMESSSVWTEAISNFLGLGSDFEIKPHNVSVQKWYGPLYRKIRSELNISEAARDGFYSSRLASHFYSNEVLQGFKLKFASTRLNAA